MDTFGIKEGYEPNLVSISNDNVSDTEYWSPHRAAAAAVYQYPVYRFANTFVGRKKVSRLIDVGCGVGTKLALIHNNHPNVEIVGIDQRGPIEFCQKTHQFGRWIVDDFENPSVSESIQGDLVICADVIEHVQDPDILLLYLKQRMSQTSFLLLSTPERDLLRGPNSLSPPNKYHVREWNFREFEWYLNDRGLKVVHHFRQFPVKFKLNSIFINEVVLRALRFKALRYNQVVLAKLA